MGMHFPPPSLGWFAPDILIGSSLPFEYRAARVARRPFSFSSAGERRGWIPWFGHLAASRPASPRPAASLRASLQFLR